MSIPHDINFLTLESALDWYGNQSFATSLFREKITHSIENDMIHDIPGHFLLLSLDQAITLLNENKFELQLVSCFQLISAAEGRLKYDFQLKIEGRSGSNLCKEFRKIFNSNNQDMKHIDVERDILEIWKKHYPSSILTTLVGDFKRLMKFRHWVAHGRFWLPSRLGRVITQYHPDLVYKETESLFDHLKGLPEGFYWE